MSEFQIRLIQLDGVVNQGTATGKSELEVWTEAHTPSEDVPTMDPIKQAMRGSPVQWVEVRPIINTKED